MAVTRTPCLPEAMAHTEADPAAHGTGAAGEPAATGHWLREDPCPVPGPGREDPPPTGYADRPHEPLLPLGGRSLGKTPLPTQVWCRELLAVPRE
jgi:hypothetical protein